MQLNQRIVVLTLMVLIPLFGQNKKRGGPKSTKNKKEIVYSNNQDTKEYLRMFEEALSRVSVSYVDSVNESDLIKAGIKGMMNPLDPYTKFLTGSKKDRLDMLRTGKYGGVGIQIGLRRDTLTVLTPFEDSPAYTEGIHSGDQIIMIDSVETKGMSLKDASNLIKGELGSIVNLTIFRPSERKKFIFELTRATFDGCGTMIELELDGEPTGISGIIISGADGVPLPFEYFDGEVGNDNNTWDGDACSMPDHSIHLTAASSILYNSSSAIAGFQFDIDDATILRAFGGEAEVARFRTSNNKKMTFKLIRANIRVKHVPYWGVDEDGIGYIRIAKFSKNAAKDFSEALHDLKDQGMAGLVIDLRSNSGGLLNNAINILDKLTDRKLNLLTTRGRIDNANKSMNSRRAPMIDRNIPVAVLINRSSASASEIVAGVIQDLDRGVIVGTKSFGKGLVQSMYNLNDTTTLKVTTAKYYIPSGRLIQKEDYLDDGFFTDGLDKKDSLFTTRGGRQVKGGGGITPDIEIKQRKVPSYVQGLWKEGVFLTFAAYYVPRNRIETPVIITDKIYSDFEKFLEEYEIGYKLPGENYLRKLKDALKFQKDFKKTSKPSFVSRLIFWKKSENTIEKMTDKLDRYYEKKRIGQFWDSENILWIRNGLQREISLVALGEKEKIRVSLFEDNVYQGAKDILLDLNQYEDILEPAPHTAETKSLSE